MKSDPLIFKEFFSNLVSDQVPSDAGREKSGIPAKTSEKTVTAHFAAREVPSE